MGGGQTAPTYLPTVDQLLLNYSISFHSDIYCLFCLVHMDILWKVDRIKHGCKHSLLFVVALCFDMN